MRGKRHSELPYPMTFLLVRATVMVYFERDGRYLMRRYFSPEKQRNRWRCIGGVKQRFEFAVSAMKRIVEADIGVTVTKWRYRGVIERHYEPPPSERRQHERMYLFTVTDWEGDLDTDSPDSELRWFDKAAVAELDRWTGERICYKALTDEMRFFMLMLDYEEDQETLIDAALNMIRIPKEPWVV